MLVLLYSDFVNENYSIVKAFCIHIGRWGSSIQVCLQIVVVKCVVWVSFASVMARAVLVVTPLLLLMLAA